MFYAYIYRDPTRQNQAFYVGKGHGSRASYHLRRSDKHPLVQRIQHIKKLGGLPTIEKIEALDEQHAFFLETCLIEVIGRKDQKKGPLLNLTDGGEGSSGTVVSDETKAKLKLTQHLRGMNGKKHSPETKMLIAGAVSGKTKGPRSDDVKMKIIETKRKNPYVYTDEVRAKMRGPRPRYECSQCKQMVTRTSLNRYHNQKCEYK